MKRNFSMLVATFILIVSCQNINCQNDSLIAFWTFDNQTANDFSGNNYHGTIKNNCSFVTGVKNKGYALHTEGEGIGGTPGGHVLLPAIPFNTFNEFTVSFWAKEYYVSYFYGEAFISFGDHNYGWLGIMNHVKQPFTSDTTFYLHYSVGARMTDGSDNIDPFFYSDPKVFDNWNFYTITYKNGYVRCYFNATLVNEGSQDILVASNKGAIGAHWWLNSNASSSRLTADIDEVKIFNKCLDENEIQHEFDLEPEPDPDPEKIHANIKVWFPILTAKVGESLAIPLYAEVNDSNAIGKYELKIDWTAKRQVLYYTGDGKTVYDYLGGDTLRLRCIDSIQIDFGKTVIKNFDIKTLLSKYDATELHIDKISLENSKINLNIVKIDGELNLLPVCKGLLQLVKLSSGTALLNDSKLEFFGKDGKEYKFSVYDYLGKCLLVESITINNSSADFDLKSLNKGYYLVKILDSDGKLIITKSFCLY